MTGAKKLAGASLTLRMLGPLAVSQAGRAVALPASRKARALLAYLALAPFASPRNRLCALLFDNASDSRGELRWYLSKLRRVTGTGRLRCTEDSVRIDLTDSLVDAHEIQRAARAGFTTLPLERARSLLALFGGEFLEGLEVDGCAEFTSWLLAQRRRYHAWRVALLLRLIECAPEAEGANHVESWLALAPFDVRAHEQLLRILVAPRTGSRRERRISQRRSGFSRRRVSTALDSSGRGVRPPRSGSAVSPANRPAATSRPPMIASCRGGSISRA